MKKSLLKTLIKDELLDTLNESMIRVNGGRMGGVETMKDNPPFANEEQWMIKHGLKEVEEPENTPAIVEAAEKEVATAKKSIESNVSTAITGMGDMVKKLPTGEPVVETKDNFVERVRTNSLSLMDEEPEIVTPVIQPKAVFTPSPDYFIAANGAKVYYKRLLKYDTADRRAKLQQFKADNPTLTRRQYMVAFNKAVDSGEIEVKKVRAFPNGFKA